MWLKYPVIIVLFLIATLLQVSFLPYFGLMGVIPNIIFILFFIMLFLKKEKEYYTELFLVITAGFFLDIFSNGYLGISIIALFILYLLMQATNHIFQERQDEYLVGYFIVSFLVCFFAYSLLMKLLSNPFDLAFALSLIILIQAVYNGVLALVGFFIYKKVTGFITQDRQLKLL